MPYRIILSDFIATRFDTNAKPMSETYT